MVLYSATRITGGHTIFYWHCCTLYQTRQLVAKVNWLVQCEIFVLIKSSVLYFCQPPTPSHLLTPKRALHSLWAFQKLLGSYWLLEDLSAPFFLTSLALSMLSRLICYKIDCQLYLLEKVRILLYVKSYFLSFI